MIACYADPPYPGQARKHYRNEVLCAEVDHEMLVTQLCSDYDCWALSTSSTALQSVLNVCPPDVRIGAWVKPFASFKPGVNPAYAWEPVILWRGKSLGRDVPTVRDWVAANITLRKGLSGAKPPEFCQWLFHFMGLSRDDEFVDLYPGTRGVQAQWELFRSGISGHIQMETVTGMEPTP